MFGRQPGPIARRFDPPEQRRQPEKLIGQRRPQFLRDRPQIATRTAGRGEPERFGRIQQHEIHLLLQDRRRIRPLGLDDGFHQPVYLEKPGDLVAVTEVELHGNRQVADLFAWLHRDGRRMADAAEDIEAAEMRRPEIRLLEARLAEVHRHPGHIAGHFGQPYHLGNQQVIAPAGVFGAKPVDQPGQPRRFGHRAAHRIGLDRHLSVVEQSGRGRHLVDRVKQFPRHRIARGQGEQLRLVRFDELGKDAPIGRKRHIQQGCGPLVGGQQNELTVAAIGIEIKIVVQLIADFRRIPRNINMKIFERSLLACQMF